MQPGVKVYALPKSWPTGRPELWGLRDADGSTRVRERERERSPLLGLAGGRSDPQWSCKSAEISPPISKGEILFIDGGLASSLSKLSRAHKGANQKKGNSAN